MTVRSKGIPVDSLLQLKQRLDRLPRKSPERKVQVEAMADLYGISPATVYRSLKAFPKLHTIHRTDRGKPRVLPKVELERYCGLGFI